MQLTMQKSITKEEFLRNKQDYYQLIREGTLFVYPTDTIYGIGCNALDEEAVQKIRAVKDRNEAPFSVIAPSKEWIHEHMELSPPAEEWLSKLPGPYTLIMKMKKGRGACVAPAVTNTNSLGIRMINHWMQDVAAELGIPVVTTSVNKTGESFMTAPDAIDEAIREAVAVVIDEGEKKGRPSQIIFLNKTEVEVKKR